MSIILHMSDCHITDATLREVGLILRHLTEFINSSEYKGRLNYIVNTGDFIDQRDIATKVLTGLRRSFPDFDKALLDWEKGLRQEYPEQKEYDSEHRKRYTRTCADIIQSCGNPLQDAYNSELEQECQRLFNQVKRVLSTFYKNVGVENKNVFVSCGNHDRTWLLGDNDIECSNSECRILSRNRYSVFQKFCEDSGITYVGGPTVSVKEADDALCFLGFDSVSPYPGSAEKYCNNCKSFDISRIITDTSGKSVVSITHKPVDDYCDEAKTEYDDQRRRKLDSFIKNHSKFVLQGDKHGFSVEHNVIRCGAPLVKKGVPIRYTIIDTETWEYTPIRYYNNYWDYDNLQEILDKVYAVSSKHIKSNVTTDFQNHGQFDHAQDVIDSASTTIRDQLSIAFRAIGEYRIGGDRNNVFDLWAVDNVFEYLYEKIWTSKFPNPFNLRGKIGSGKSILLIELYCHILSKVLSGNKDILPFYYSFRDCFSARSHINTDTLIQDAIKSFNDFCTATTTLKQEVIPSHRHSRFLFMIDGLDELRFYGEEGKKLSAQIEVFCDTIASNNDLYVLSINQYKKSTTLDRINWNYHPNSDVMYLDPVYLVPITDIEEQKRDAFFKAINSIFAENTISEALVLPLIKTGKVTADIGLVHFLYGNRQESLNMKQERPENPDKWYQVLRYFDSTQQIITWKRGRNERQEQLKKAAYDYLTVENFDYTTVLCSVQDFKLIIGNESVRNMLCAEYFVDLFAAKQVSSWKPFMTHDLALFICAALFKEYNPAKPNDMRRLLKVWEENAENIVSAQLLSMLIYILGQLVSLNVDDSKRNELITTVSERSRNHTAFDVHCLRRSANIALTYMAASNNMHSPNLEDLLSEIVFQKDNREYARIFLLNYYGDAARNYKSNEMLIKCEYSDGFDFDLVFRNIYWLLDNESNPVYLYNAFMLASFVKSRLSVRNKPNTIQLTHPFFFEQTYSDYDIERDISVLAIAEQTAKKAYNLAESAIADSTLRAAYKSSLAEMEQLFIDCQKLFSQRLPEKDLHHQLSLRTHPEYAFDKLRKLTHYGRSCWDYKKNPSLTSKKVENNILAKNTSPYGTAHEETVVEHLYESMLIAFLYLPEEVPDLPTYNKKDIISIIFLHEFGIAQCGDIPFESKQYEKYASQMENTALYFSLWSNMLLNSNSRHELFDLSVKYTSAEKMHENTDTNAEIAREIGQIQREYKRLLIASDPNKESRWIVAPTTSKWFKCTKLIYEMLIEKNPRFSS